MRIDIDLILFSEDKELGNKKNFINFLTKNWSDKIRLWDAEIWHKQGYQIGYEVGLKETNQNDPPMYMPFQLIAGYDEKIKASALTFRTDVLDAASDTDRLFFYDIFFAACKEFKPIYACADETKDDERPCWDQIEYHMDPYLFCLEPPILPYLFDIIHDRDYLEKFFNDFIRNKSIIAKLNEIKKVMDHEELIGLIKKYSKKVIESDDGGIGILKTKIQGVYPRYFIRKEIRKRGVKLDDGLVEKDAKLWGVKE